MDLAVSIAGGGVSDGANLGTGDGVFAQLNGSFLEFKSLVEGANITITSTATEITIATGAGVGEANTTSNVGTGEGLALAKDVVNLPFKTLLGETDRIILTGNPTDVTFTIGTDIVTLNDAQTLTNKTLTTPTIGNFTNAVHDHSNAAGGGQLTNSAIAIGAEIAVSKLADGNAGQFLRTDSPGTGVEWADDIASLTFIIDGGSSVLTTGVHGDLEIPFNCTIERVTLLADQTGDVEIDLFVDTFASYPPVVGDSIVAAAPPTITTDDNSQDITLTGWTTALAAGSTIRYNVNSVTTIQRVTIALLVRKTG